MKPSFTLKSSVLGFTLLCLAAGSSALTLGRVRGAVLLGQPLEVSIPVQVDSEEGGTAQCFEADVFYGDVRLESSRVAVNAESTQQANALLVRVLASARVDEPVVTVYLRAGCGQKTSRRYVVLADLASEVSPSVSIAPVPKAVPVQPIPGPASADAPRAAGAQGGAAQAGASPTAKASAASRKPAKPAAEKVEKQVPTPRKTERVASSGKHPRLKLAPLDLTERDPTLKISDALLSAPLEDLQKRAEAVAQWRALNATPQDILRDDARMQSLEGGLKELQDVTAKNKRALSDIATRLEQAESQRYANPLVYGLAVVLLACIAALVFAWTRLRDASRNAIPWWRDSDKPEARTAGSAAAVFASTGAKAQAPDAPITLPPALEPSAAAGMDAVDIDLELGESAFMGAGKAQTPQRTEPAAVPRAAGSANHQDHHGFSSSAMGGLRAINTQEMLDVRQQAEFFMTLGQYDEAIELLKNGIHDSGDANPLVYLDLLKVFHTLSRKEDYDHYRDDFNQLFTGHVPVYTGFNHGGNGLDAYPQVCQRIAELWPSQDAVDFIEGCLTRAPGAQVQQEFDLEAYRELLMLHGVARRLDGASDSVLAPFSAAKAVPYLAEGTYGTEATMAVPALQAEAPASVDLDLSEPESQPENNLIDFEVSGFSKVGGLPPANKT